MLRVPCLPVNVRLSFRWMVYATTMVLVLWFWLHCGIRWPFCSAQTKALYECERKAGAKLMKFSVMRTVQMYKWLCACKLIKFQRFFIQQRQNHYIECKYNIPNAPHDSWICYFMKNGFFLLLLLLFFSLFRFLYFEYMQFCYSIHFIRMCSICSGCFIIIISTMLIYQMYMNWCQINGKKMLFCFCSNGKHIRNFHT